MGKLRPATSLFCLLILAAAVPAAQAAWDVNGNRVPSAGHDAQLVTDEEGGAILVWASGTPGMGTEPEIYMQRISMMGVFLWDWVQLTDDFDNQYEPVMVADGEGGALVAWEDYRVSASPSVYVQRVDADGHYQWAQYGQYINHGAYDPQLALYDTGRAIITWAETYPTRLATQKMGGGGVFQWPGEDGDEYITLIGGSYSRIAHDGAGGALVAAGGAYGLHVDTDGNEDWAVEPLADGPVGTDAQVIGDGAGGGIFTWDGTDIMAQRKNAAGARMWGSSGVTVLAGGADHQMVSDGAGGVLVVAVVTGNDIRVTRINADGGYDWSSAGVLVCDDAALQELPQVASDGHGGAYVVWQDSRNDPTTGIDIYAQHINAYGSRQWANDGVPICTASGDQSEIHIAATGYQSAILIWKDERDAAGIYAQAIRYDGSIGDPSFMVTDQGPVTNSIHEPLDWPVRAGFTLDVNPLTLTHANIQVYGSLSGQRHGVFSLRGTDGFRFNPDDLFCHGEVVTVVMTDGVESAGGQPLVPTSWSFTVMTEGLDGEFLATTNYAVEEYPIDICAADLNGDGDQDLMSANMDSDTISILAGRGDGTFTTGSSLPVGDRPRGVIAADLDGDFDPDIVSANYGSSTVTVLRNAGNGSFPTRAHFPTDAGPLSVCAADFDNDGDLDVATANLEVDGINVLTNSGSGSLGSAVSYAAGDNPVFIACGDLNGDGYADLVTANLSSDDISVFFNKKTGMFAPKIDIFLGGSPNKVYPVDVDKDGDLDLVVSCGTGNDVVVLFNNGAGLLGVPDHYATGIGPYAGLPADLDGDEDLDLVYCNANSDNIWVRLNDGSGNFGTQAVYAAGDNPTSMVAADLDGDGALDLAAANRYSDDISVFLNHHSLSGVEEGDVPTVTALLGSTPNPFNPETKISYSLKTAGHVRLTVHDARGARVAILMDERQEAGKRFVTWDGRTATGRRAASGVYFARLVTDEGGETRKMTLIK